ncbi:hypothetical protein ACFL4T_00420 [candidate division KSB1 bacterium]
MEKHVNILGVLYIIVSAFHLFAAVIVFVILFGAGLISADMEALTITTIVGSVIAAIIIFTSLPGLIGGIGLLKLKNWARILVLILGFFNLLAVPLGTILGVYTLWVLLNKDAEQVFQQNLSKQEENL